MKIAILAGGTGGHIFPALAVAKALQQRGHQVFWIGAAGGMETRIVPPQHIDLKMITIQNLRGRGLLRYGLMPLRLLRAILQARAILKQEHSDLVIGFGGFVSGPGGLAAKWLKIPLIIHEQNAIAGMTNRYLAKNAQKVLVGFSSALPESHNRVVTGNPVREEFLALRMLNYTPHVPLRVLVVGGSLGAQVFNEVMPKCLQQLVLQHIQIELWQQTGIKQFDSTQAQFAALELPAKVNAFIEDMANAYTWADLIICRAGALTLAELGIIGKPAILIPYPYAVDDHQTQNAFEAVHQGAAVLISQSELSVAKLVKILTDLIQHPEKLKVMAANMKALGHVDALTQIVSLCENLASKKQ